MRMEYFVDAGHLEGVDDLLAAIDNAATQRYGHVKTAHHVWVNSLVESDPKLFSWINEVRGPFLGKVCDAYPGYACVSVPEVDELYWGVSSPEASGSDRSLVDCHYDAPFGGLISGNIVFYRVIVACNKNTSTFTVFPESGIRARMTTGDYHGLDYNNDLHCVEGHIPVDQHRVLLKLHYMAVPPGAERYASFVKWINVHWTFGSRALMQMSAAPTTLVGHCVALIVNSSRIIWNNFMAILCVITVLVCVLYIWSKNKHRALDTATTRGASHRS